MKTRPNKKGKDQSALTYNELKLSKGRADASHSRKELYSTASKLEDWNTNELDRLPPDQQLESISKEINVHVKITQLAIFRIGELLWNAKNICQQENMNYKDWIEQHFEFKYDTANNMVNVYRNLGGYQNLAINVKPSILYRVGSASFPKELTEPLFVSGKLENMKGKDIKALEQSFEMADEEEQDRIISEINKKRSIHRQVKYNLDMCKKALKVLTDLHKNIESRGKSGFHGEFIETMKSNDPVAYDINSSLFKSLESSITHFSNAIIKAEDKLNPYIEDAQEVE